MASKGAKRQKFKKKNLNQKQKMSYNNNPTHTLENGILTIPNDCITTIEGKTYFSFKIPGSRMVRMDNSVEISKNQRVVLEEFASIFGLTKAQIRDMKKKDLVDYLTPRIVFE